MMARIVGCCPRYPKPKPKPSCQELEVQDYWLWSQAPQAANSVNCRIADLVAALGARSLGT